MINKIYLTTISFGVLFLTSCTTYYISLDSFKTQFANIGSYNLKNVTVRGPMYETYHYKANTISTIKCTDSNGASFELTNSPSIEMRVTYGQRNKQSIFYFDTVFIKDGSVVGLKSRFMDFIGQTIPLDSIKKIEVQDGHKKFTYVYN